MKYRMDDEHLLGGELGGVRPGVVDRGVSQVLSQVGNGALAGDGGLDEEAEHGEHGEAAVLDLLHLQLSQGVGVLRQAQGVEGATGVQGVRALKGAAGGSAGSAEDLSAAHEDNLSTAGARGSQQQAGAMLGPECMHAQVKDMRSVAQADARWWRSGRG